MASRSSIVSTWLLLLWQKRGLSMIRQGGGVHQDELPPFRDPDVFPEAVAPFRSSLLQSGQLDVRRGGHHRSTPKLLLINSSQPPNVQSAAPSTPRSANSDPIDATRRTALRTPAIASILLSSCDRDSPCRHRKQRRLRLVRGPPRRQWQSTDPDPGSGARWRGRCSRGFYCTSLANHCWPSVGRLLSGLDPSCGG